MRDLVSVVLCALIIGLAQPAQGAPWRIRAAGGRSCTTQEYLRFFNASCSNTAHPQLGPLGTANDYKGWEIDVFTSSLFPYDLATIQAYFPTEKKVQCRGYVAPLNLGKCTDINVGLKGVQDTNGGYRWRLIPVAGKPNYFNIVANKRTTSAECQQFLGVRYNCTDRRVVLYKNDQGLRTQWLLTPFNGNTPPTVTSVSSLSSTSIGLQVKRPSNGPTPYAYKVLYKNTKSGTGKWQTAKFVGETEAESTTTIILGGLDICDEYDVKVKALRLDPQTETLESPIVKAKPICKPVPPEVNILDISWTTTSDTPYGIKQFQDLELNTPESAQMLEPWGQPWGLFGHYVWSARGRKLQSTAALTATPRLEEADLMPMSPDEVRSVPMQSTGGHGRGLKVVDVDVTSPLKDCAIYRFSKVPETFEVTQYCAGVSLYGDAVPKNWICAKGSVLKGDPAYIYVCNLNPSKNYYFWMRADNEFGKGPLTRSNNAFGELKSIISWTRPVRGACALDIYIQNEYDPMLGPMDYRVVVYETDQEGNKVQLSAGTNDPFTFEPLIFRVPAKDSYTYDIDATISAGLSNKAHDQATFTYLNGRCVETLDQVPDQVIGGIYYYDATQMAYPERAIV